MDTLEQAAFDGTFVFPFVAVIGSWLIAGRVRRSWLIHLLFFPFLLLGEWLLLVLFAWAAGDDSETPAQGLILFPIFIWLALAVVAYYLGIAAMFLIGLLHARSGRAPSTCG